jgi:hypothetical protein
MKKYVFIILSLALTSGAFAQSVVKKAKVKEDKKELRSDIKEKREEKAEVRKDLTHLQVKKAKADRKDVKAAHKEEDKDAEALENQGVKSPKAKARHEIHEEKEAKKKTP